MCKLALFLLWLSLFAVTAENVRGFGELVTDFKNRVRRLCFLGAALNKTTSKNAGSWRLKFQMSLTVV
jgi:hypothetical protein